ncbi:MAG: hypothetical protein AB7V32_04895 [Candidatus Berkiella sp.]
MTPDTDILRVFMSVMNIWIVRMFMNRVVSDTINYYRNQGYPQYFYPSLNQSHHLKHS